MKPAETQVLYEKACATRRIKPQQEEFEQWHKNLRDFEPRDVQGALDAWWASTEKDSNGDLKSKWLPVPGELMGLVIRARDKRIASSREPEDLLWFICPDRHRYTAFAAKSAETPTRRCHCGKTLELVKREAA